MSEQKPANPANTRNRLGTHQQILSRYTDQPERMPSAVRDRIERLWSNQPVQLYAMADLDASMRLGRIWRAVGPEQVAVALCPPKSVAAVPDMSEVRPTAAMTTSTQHRPRKSGAENK